MDFKMQPDVIKKQLEIRVGKSREYWLELMDKVESGETVVNKDGLEYNTEDALAMELHKSMILLKAYQKLIDENYELVNKDNK